MAARRADVPSQRRARCVSRAPRALLRRGGYRRAYSCCGGGDGSPGGRTRAGAGLHRGRRRHPAAHRDAAPALDAPPRHQHRPGTKLCSEWAQPRSPGYGSAPGYGAASWRSAGCSQRQGGLGLPRAPASVGKSAARPEIMPGGHVGLALDTGALDGGAVLGTDQPARVRGVRRARRRLAPRRPLLRAP